MERERHQDAKPSHHVTCVTPLHQGGFNWAVSYSSIIIYIGAFAIETLEKIARIAIDNADPIHGFPCEGATILGTPRNVDDDPIAIEGFNLNGIEFVIEPVGVSGGVGSGVEENFKMHSVNPFD